MFIPVHCVYHLSFKGKDKSGEKETLVITVVKPFVYVQPVAFDKGMQLSITLLPLHLE